MTYRVWALAIGLAVDVHGCIVRIRFSFSFSYLIFNYRYRYSVSVGIGSLKSQRHHQVSYVILNKLKHIEPRGHFIASSLYKGHG